MSSRPRPPPALTRRWWPWARPTTQQLAAQARNAELAGDFDRASQSLDQAMTSLLDAAGAASSGALESSLASFDQGRLLLAVISATSVVVAILTAWLWVGNGVVRRLSRLSERMRGMAGGDLVTPVPEVSRDEIGELAGALEVFRQQALEVQRLNLVEQLYEELRVANDELQRMQDRLVAQEKLAALGELVSGVAHEISNPLNFVKNFCEASQELYTELAETLESYRTEMSDDDAALVDEISQELTSSLGRVHANGGRALAIVERMRGLGVVGGEPAPADLNPALRQAVQAGCEAFRAEWGDFSVDPVFDLDDNVGEALLVEADFGEAIVNLVLNACYAMRLKQEEIGDGYQPQLLVTARRDYDMVEVKIRDNGTGIADDVVDHIFNPFFSTRDGASGAGLGLPIAADVARRIGGDLVADTVPGQYAEFTFTAPVAAPAASPVAVGD
ncbi:MAG: HAMP domain-containing histidine kinase [Dehalococcoidia bacterium]|nr:HAMP domain-containing histidine kinase [Dehalococcoidia bacterium]